MKRKKEIGLIIKFDDVEYFDEETAILYQQFFELLASIKKVSIPKNFGKALVELIKSIKTHLKRFELLKSLIINSPSDFAKISLKP